MSGAFNTTKRICAAVPPRIIGGIDKNRLSKLLNALDKAELYAIDLWGAESFSADLLTSRSAQDPWELLRMLRDGVKSTRLRLTLRGQSLLGSGVYADDVVEYLVARAAENGVGIIRVYDALNDPRNIETVVRAAKKYDLELDAAMIYTSSPAGSVAFYAGYASLLEGMGVDGVSIIDPEDKLDLNILKEIDAAIKASVSIPLTLGNVCRELIRPVDVLLSNVVSGMDIDLSLDMIDGAPACLGTACDIVKNVISKDSGRSCFDGILPQYIERARSEAGWPTMAAPIADIIYERAALLASGDAESHPLAAGYRALVSGLYGRLPMPPAPEIMAALGGNASMILNRPADLLEPELDTLRPEIAPYLEQAEDILTYAMAGDAAISFFEHRKCARYGIDEANAVPALGVHII